MGKAYGSWAIGAVLLLLVAAGFSPSTVPTKEARGEFFQWGSFLFGAGGLLVGICGFLYGVYRDLRTRQLRVSDAFEVRRCHHQRAFFVRLHNLGVDIYDIRVCLCYARDGEAKEHPMAIDGQLANPLKFFQSRSFFVLNDDPSCSLGFENMMQDDVSIRIYSDSLLVKSIPGTAFKAQLDEFSRVDPTMPPKPQPQSNDRKSRSGGIDPPWIDPPPNWLNR